MALSHVWLQLCSICAALFISKTAQCLPSAAPALYVFGASMVDSGENSVAMPFKSSADFLPYGSDYFGKPAGRWSNGRTFMDLITQGLGFGLLSPYLKSYGSNFTNGVNFASSGSTAQNTSVDGPDDSGGLFSLMVQIDQFMEYQAYVLSGQNGFHQKAHLQDHFSSSLYFIETAHNDYLKAAFKTPDFDANATVLAVISAMREALQVLYNLGARTVIVMNVTPLGCNPSTLSNPYATENWDEYGCKADYLQIVNLHNEHLIMLLDEFRSKNAAAEWILYDAYSIMLDGYRNPSKYGIKYPFKACCGAGGEYNYNEDVKCGHPGTYINGTYMEATKCDDPSLHIIWDSLHPVESFSQYLAQGVLNGTHLSPTFNILERIRSAKVASI